MERMVEYLGVGHLLKNAMEKVADATGGDSYARKQEKAMVVLNGYYIGLCTKEVRSAAMGVGFGGENSGESSNTGDGGHDVLDDAFVQKVPLVRPILST